MATKLLEKRLYFSGPHVRMKKTERTAKSMRRVLVVIDMQNDFITGALGSDEARKIVAPVSEYIQAFPGEVLFTKDTHYADYLDSREGKKLPVIHCVENTFGWQLTPPLENFQQSHRERISQHLLLNELGLSEFFCYSKFLTHRR